MSENLPRSPNADHRINIPIDSQRMVPGFMAAIFSGQLGTLSKDEISGNVRG